MDKKLRIIISGSIVQDLQERGRVEGRPIEELISDALNQYLAEEDDSTVEVERV